MSSDEASNDDDPLDDIFVDGDEIDRTTVRDLLEPYLQIDTDSGDLYPTPAYQDLSSKDKIIVTLTAQRAKELRGLIESAAIGPADISNLSGVKEGTVKPAVRELDEEGLIANTDNGYTIGGPQLQRVRSRLLEDE